ncbi:MAG: DUF2934 domain-containing protein [Proteobacteria bacterium]|nr:DUF2934 domain-containing protein [Pseudomonadota bacterium]
MASQIAKPAASKPAKPQMEASAQPATSAATPKPNSASNPNGLLGSSLPPVTVAMRRTMIAEAAYYIAQQRGFAEGRAMDDWLLAEGQIDAALSG